MASKAKLMYCGPYLAKTLLYVGAAITISLSFPSTSLILFHHLLVSFIILCPHVVRALDRALASTAYHKDKACKLFMPTHAGE